MTIIGHRPAWPTANVPYSHSIAIIVIIQNKQAYKCLTKYHSNYVYLRNVKFMILSLSKVIKYLLNNIDKGKVLDVQPQYKKNTVLVL